MRIQNLEINDLVGCGEEKLFQLKLTVVYNTTAEANKLKEYCLELINRLHKYCVWSKNSQSPKRRVYKKYKTTQQSSGDTTTNNINKSQE